MTNQKFPYQAFILTASMRPKCIKFIRATQWFGGSFHEKDGGSFVCVTDIYPDFDSAIQAGRKKLIAQQEKVDKMQAKIRRQSEALEAAAKKGEAS